MRDNHHGYPEIMDTYQRAGQYFGTVRIVLADGTPTIEFGVSGDGYAALRRILNSRPFDSMPGLPHRFFFTGSFTRATGPGQENFEFSVRIEQGTAAKQFQFHGPEDTAGQSSMVLRIEVARASFWPQPH